MAYFWGGDVCLRKVLADFVPIGGVECMQNNRSEWRDAESKR